MRFLKPLTALLSRLAPRWMLRRGVTPEDRWPLIYPRTPHKPQRPKRRLFKGLRP
jgi:hypothetical protein